MVLILLPLSGCATLMGRPRGPMEEIDLTQIKKEGYTMGSHGVMQALPTGDEAPSIVLEVNNGKRSFERVPLTPNQPMFVADLLRDAKLISRVGRIRVAVLRPNGDKPPVRLDIDFDPSGKRVKDGMNYSLRPGDHVVVNSDSRGMFAQFAGSNIFTKNAK